MRRSLAILIVVAALGGCAGEAPATRAAAQSPSLAQDAVLVRAGQDLASANCATCHAIGPTGASPFADAPPFHSLSARYPVEDLAEAFAEGAMVGHPAMPAFQFAPEDIDALIAYLASVQPAR